MGKKFKLIILTLAVFGMLAGALVAFGSVSARGNAVSISDTVPVMDFRDHINAGGNVLIMNPQQRGTSDLVRSLVGISLNIDTTDLPVGAYSIWTVVFNNPSVCSDGECGLDDLSGDPEVEASLIWTTGGIVGPDRMGHFSGSIGMGLDGAPGQVPIGEGLSNPLGAEVHIVVRYHGRAMFGDATALGEQISTLGGSCDTISLGTDPDGFSCYDPQVAIHNP